VTAPHDHVPLRDHWWPRPGWRPGRIALTWHLVFPHSTPLARHVAAYQRAFDGVPTAPEQARGFLPHVTVAYSRVDADVAPYAAALAGVVRPPTTVPVTEVTLIRQERLLAPHWQYRWTVAPGAQLGPPPSASPGHRDEDLRQQLDL
jgi:hypothetical protein